MVNLSVFHGLSWVYIEPLEAIAEKNRLILGYTGLEMHDEIFPFEIFKNFMKIWKYFKTPFYVFHETFNFQYKVT